MTDISCPRRRKVQVWIHVNRRVLVLRTTPERGDFWQPVTGGVEAGEDFPEAALREAREETGLVFPAPPVSIDYEFSFESPFGSAIERVYLLAAGPAGAELPVVRIDPVEHVEYRWVTPGEAGAMLKFESNRVALGKIIVSGLLDSPVAL